MSYFDPKAVRRWRRDVWRAFRSEGFTAEMIPAALVMTAVAIVGTHLPSLSELTGQSEGYSLKVLRRLRKQRVLSGQTLRAGWEHDEFGSMSVLLDGMVAAGEIARFVNKKRSEGQRKRDPTTRARGKRTRRSPVVVGPYAPKIQKSNPLYGLPEWEKSNKGKS